jgi:signal transduction histidine kinase
MLRTRLWDLLGIDVPIILAGMGAGATSAEFAAAVSNEGGLGSVGSLFRSADTVKRDIDLLPTLTNRNFAINHIPQTLDVESFQHTLLARPAVISFALDDPGDLIRQAHDVGSRVETHLALASELPLVDGHRRQLEEVVVNLVHNAVEAMDATTDRDRVLRVRSGIKDHDAITVAVQDSGPGIDPKRIDGIFGAFFSSKSHGMGLGLAICRMIIEHHGGHLTASSDGKSGSLFQFILPIESTKKARLG